MSEINKRILTSLFLILVAFIAIYNKYILGIVLLFLLFQLFFEFNFILKKIFKPKEKFALYLSLIIILIFLCYLKIFTFLTLTEVLGNKSFLYIIICTCIFSDIGGYVVGKSFKGKKLTKISPNKTYSGMIGSYFFSLLFVVIIFDGYMNVEKLFFLIIITSTVSQIGDIFISFLKRKSNLKDASSLLPGHGGLLDRFDGLIFAIPISSIFFNII